MRKKREGDSGNTLPNIRQKTMKKTIKKKYTFFGPI